MAFIINPVENHREREKGVLVYPVYSRRSKGLSAGINLFPGKKICNFNCPYCEVFPFSSACSFSPAQMEEDLRSCLACAAADEIPVKDICFSGSGEPTLSRDFAGALKIVSQIRNESAPAASIVLITNGTGLLRQEIFSLLKEASLGREALDIWLKLDAATPQWYEKINRCEIPLEKLISKIKEFASVAPVTIQTMLCSVGGSPPPRQEELSWLRLVKELAACGNIRKVQIYGKARPAPEDPLASELPVKFLEERCGLLQGLSIPVEIY